MKLSITALIVFCALILPISLLSAQTSAPTSKFTDTGGNLRLAPTASDTVNVPNDKQQSTSDWKTSKEETIETPEASSKLPKAAEEMTPASNIAPNSNQEEAKTSATKSTTQNASDNVPAASNTTENMQETTSSKLPASRNGTPNPAPLNQSPGSSY